MTKMPPDGYPAFLQYLQSGRVRKIPAPFRREYRYTVSSQTLAGVRFMSTMTGSLPGLPPHSGLILYRMDVDEYESLAGVLKDPRVELIDGYLVRKMTKKPRHTIITEWLRDRLAYVWGNPT